MSSYKFETLSIHAGQAPDATGAPTVPVYRTNAYVFKNAKSAADLFGLRENGFIYSRIGDPTTAVLEERLSALEGGIASVALSSGTSAIFYTIATICQSGDEVISASNLYGGTYTQFAAILPKWGIHTKFANIQDPQSFARLVTPKTRLIFVESIGNPTLDVADIAEIAKVAKAAEVPLVVDGTFTTPYLLRAIKYGADIVINSLSKWIGGHGTSIGGSVTDAGTFNWKNPKFELFTQPDPNYHGLRWAYDLPAELAPAAFALRLRTVPLRNLGACISPDNSWMFLQGAETLGLRMERHSENALTVAKFLKNDKRAAWVRYPGLESDENYPTAKQYFKKYFGGMVVFGPKGGYDSAIKFVDNLPLFSYLANVGDTRSLSIHPASTTHSQLSEEELKRGVLGTDLVRLSIGIEHIDDILDALDKGLAASQK